MKKIAYEAVFHVGDLDRKNKQMGSNEGDGVSVSVHPAAWAHILKNGSEGFALTKDGDPASFLVATSLTKAEKAEIVAWAKANGWLEEHGREIWRVSYYDADLDERAWMECPTREEAVSEKEYLESARVTGPYRVEAPTEKLMTASHFSQNARLTLDNSTTFDLALLQWVKDTRPEFDGVWWQEALDPWNYSAPRGVIFQDKLADWNTMPMDFSGYDIEAELDADDVPESTLQMRR